MKKLLIATMVVLVAAVAVAQEVTSVNTVGFTKIGLAPDSEFSLVSLPFDAIDKAEANLLGVFGTNSLTQLVVPGLFPPSQADQVWLWDPSGLEWAAYYQGTDGEFRLSDAWPSDLTPTNPPVLPGEGFFILSSSISTETNNVPLMGEVVSVQTQEVDIVDGFQALGYPFSAKVNIQDAQFVESGATILPNALFPPSSADQVWVFDDEADTYVGYYLNTDGKWYAVDDYPGGSPVDVDLDLGQGFWYQAVSAFPGPWTTTNSYIDNL